MMWVWNETCYSTQDGKRLDFKMSGSLGNDVAFVACNIGVTFFVHIKVFNKTFLEEIIKCQLFGNQIL